PPEPPPRSAPAPARPRGPASTRGARGLKPCLRQALGVRVREAAVDDQDRGALRPGLALVRRHREVLASPRCRPHTHRHHPRRPGVADILAPPIGRCWEYGHLLSPQRGLTGELAPLLLPGGIGIQRED